MKGNETLSAGMPTPSRFGLEKEAAEAERTWLRKQVDLCDWQIRDLQASLCRQEERSNALAHGLQSVQAGLRRCADMSRTESALVDPHRLDQFAREIAIILSGKDSDQPSTETPLTPVGLQRRAEMAITAAMVELEKVGAHPHLTDAVVSMSNAKMALNRYVELIKKSPRPAPFD